MTIHAPLWLSVKENKQNVTKTKELTSEKDVDNSPKEQCFHNYYMLQILNAS